MRGSFFLVLLFLEFYRAITSYGCDTVPGDPNQRDWTRFKELSNLRKSDSVLDDYYRHIIGICHAVLYPSADRPPPEEKDLEGLTVEKAKKLLKRVEGLRRLREQVLLNPRVSLSKS